MADTTKQAVAIIPPSQTPAPMQIIADAVAKGAPVETMEKLLALQERWEANEARKAFVAAMARFKANPPTVLKTKKVNVQGGPSYKHAQLGDICEAVGPALSKEGLSYGWETASGENNTVKVTCVITHEGGHSERTFLQAAADTSGKKNPVQAIGSTVTYLQRYTLLAACGIAAAEDDDGRGGEDPPPRPTRQQFEHNDRPWQGWLDGMFDRLDKVRTPTMLDALLEQQKSKIDSLRSESPQDHKRLDEHIEKTATRANATTNKAEPELEWVGLDGEITPLDGAAFVKTFFDAFNGSNLDQVEIYWENNSGQIAKLPEAAQKSLREFHDDMLKAGSASVKEGKEAADKPMIYKLSYGPEIDLLKPSAIPGASRKAVPVEADRMKAWGAAAMHIAEKAPQHLVHQWRDMNHTTIAAIGKINQSLGANIAAAFERRLRESDETSQDPLDGLEG